MRKIIIPLFVGTAIFAMSSCSTTTNITGSWKKPGATANHYKSIFVSALTTNIAAKNAVENGLQKKLKPGLKVYKSVDTYSQEFENSNMANLPVLLEKIRLTNAEAILTIALVDNQNEQRFVRETTTYDPMSRYGYYSRWSAYNGYWAKFYTTGYYVTDKVYFLQTNLYDAKTEELIWSAQSTTYNPSGINKFLKGYLRSVKNKMKDDGLID